MAAEEEVRLIFAAEDRFSDVADNVTASLKGIGDQAATTQATIDAAAIGPVANWEELEKKLLGVTDRTAEVAQGASDMGQEMERGLDQGTRSAATLEDQVAQLGLGVKEVNGEAQIVSTELPKGFDDSASSAGNLIGQVKTLATAAASAWAAIKSVQKVLDWGEAGAALINLEHGFEQATAAAGMSSEAMLAQIEAVGRGIIDDDEAMREFILTTRAAGSGIASEWPQLIQVALASTAEGIGTAQGNLEQLDQYIRTGFGRGLKQMGIMVPDNSQIMDAYAASLGRTADSLTEAEQAQARMNAVLVTAAPLLERTNSGADVAGGGFSRLKNVTEDFAEGLETRWAPAIEGAASAVADFIDAILKADDLWRQKASGWQAPEVTPQVMAITAMPPEATLPRDQGQALQTTQAGIDALTQSAWAWSAAGGAMIVSLEGVASAASWTTDELAQLAGNLDGARQAADDSAKTAHYEAEAFHGVGDAYEEAARTGLHARDVSTDLGNEARTAAGKVTTLTGVLDIFSGMTTGAARAVGQMTSAFYYANYVSNILKGGIEGLTHAYGHLQVEAMGLAGPVGFLDEYATALTHYQNVGLGLEGPQANEYATNMEYQVALLNYRASEAEAAANKEAAAGVSAWNEQKTAMESYYQSWQSSADAITEPTQALDWDALEKQAGLPRQDAFDENARRAADVVAKGAESPWVTQAGMTNPQEALQYMKDFYSGRLGEEQYNWQAGIDQYREQTEQTVGEQNLAAQFQAKLAEAGLGPDSALVADAFNFDLSGAGGLSATNFAEAFKGFDWPKLVGQPVGAAILSGASTALAKPNSAFTGNMKAFIVDVVDDYFFGGAHQP